MTKVNRPDTLHTELRELQRRLRLLESARTLHKPARSPVPLLPARPADWPGTTAPDWERLALVSATGGPWQIQLNTALDPDTTGEVRVLVNGQPIDPVIRVSDTLPRHVIPLPVGDLGEAEIAVEARRTSGDGLVRALAVLQVQPG